MTVKDFLQSLGGATQVSRDLGVPFTTVATWGQRNSIPPWRMTKVVELALSKGKPIPAAFEDAAA